MELKIEFCGVVIEIQHTYDYIIKLCRDWLAEDGQVPDFTVSVTDADIEAEKRICTETYPDGVFEATSIHRKIVQGMVKHGVILIHSAVIAVDGEAYAFLAESGVGKSTHLRQWMKHFGERATIVNGDKPMYSFAGGRLTVHGSPWKGKEGWGENISLPVKAFCFLERGNTNEIKSADKGDIARRLFRQVLLPTDARELALFMGILDRTVKEVPFYTLKCNISEEAAALAYNEMSKENR